MNFRLEKSTASNRAMSKFFVIDDSAAIVGTINVKPSEENDLRAHWKDVPPSSQKNAATQDRSRPVAAMPKASKERGRMTRQAILRGC